MNLTTHPEAIPYRPAITVVIPVYNGENFLAEAIESVLAQTVPASEILVIDDGSQDNSAAIAESFAGRIRLIKRKNSGVSDARNHAISLSRTEWIAFIDHDDLWEPNHLENLTLTLQRRPDADLCYTSARRFIREHPSEEFKLTDELLFPDEADIGAALLERCAFITSSVAIRRSAVLAVGGFDNRYTNYEDWDLWLRLKHNGARFAHSPAPTLIYRVHPLSATHNPIPGLNQSHEIVRRNILPYLKRSRRFLHGQKVLSRLESEASILLRQQRMAGALRLMLRSILRYSLHSPHRYKVAVHMLLYGYEKQDV